MRTGAVPAAEDIESRVSTNLLKKCVSVDSVTEVDYCRIAAACSSVFTADSGLRRAG